jgi:cyclophilin family peptidyl-prolyl cis-trans isomerase
MVPDRQLWIGRAAVLVCYFCGFASATHGQTFVRLDYSLGLADRARDTAFIELFDDRPLTRDNFMQYVNGDRYDGTIMHRLSRNFVVQGGGFYPEFHSEPSPISVSLDPNEEVDLDGNPMTDNPTVMNEFNNSPMRSNLRGTLAMAKLGPPTGQPPTPETINSATNQWFVNLNNNASNLDGQNGGFTVFARVLGDGMEMFDAMNTLAPIDLNPDANNNGVREAGPFSEVPLFHSLGVGSQLISNLVVLEDAERIDYFGAGVSTEVPIGGINFVDRDAFFDTGTGFFGAGAFGIGTNRRLGLREGFSTGRLIVNLGTLAPGLQLGTATIGRLDQRDTGTLEIQLGGPTAHTEYDRLVLFGDAQLAGTLDVSLLGGFTPSPGHTFTVLTAQSITGDFDELQLPVLTAGLVWDVNVSNTSVTLSAAAADFNRDGVVNAADYTVWRDMRGTTVIPFASADGSGNGMIDAADYTIWKNNFGNRRGGLFGGAAGSLAAAAVPEPSTLLLILAASSAVAMCRRFRRN